MGVAFGALEASFAFWLDPELARHASQRFCCGPAEAAVLCLAAGVLGAVAAADGPARVARGTVLAGLSALFLLQWCHLALRRPRLAPVLPTLTSLAVAGAILLAALALACAARPLLFPPRGAGAARRRPPRPPLVRPHARPPPLELAGC